MTAYALRFENGRAAVLNNPIELTSANGDSWRIEVRVLGDAWSGEIGFFAGDQSSPDRFQKTSADALRLRVRFASGSTNNETGSVLSWSSDDEYLLGLSSSPTELAVFRNEYNQVLRTGSGRQFMLTRFGSGGSASGFAGIMLEAKVIVNGATIHHWLNTNGAGTEWTDIVGGNNANLSVGTWPSDNSQWEPYDDGAGSTEHITSSGGIASAVAGGAASTQIINEQVLGVSGIAAAVASGIASATIVNEQVNSSGGIASAVASGSASISVINEQVVSSGGIAAAIAGATASTQVINEQTSEQIVSSGGIAASTGSASASTQIISEQVVSSGGVAAALAGGTASSEQVNEQIIISGGQANAYASGFASTQIVNEQNSEQIITTGGASSALASATASTQFISEQIISTGGIAQAFASGVLSSLVINRTSGPLAPERMSATRLMPAITAQHILPAVTGSRLINNISAQRV